MNENQHGAIWVRAIDLERLFSANRICYLIGSYDGSGNYGDILQLHANTDRLLSVAEDILAAPTVYWQRALDHDELTNRHPWLFHDSCFLYYVPFDELEDAESTLDDQQLVVVPHPPQTFSQVIVYGGGFLNSWWGWGEQKLHLIEHIANWLDGASPDSQPVAIVGQQISNNFLDSPNEEQFAEMLDHASMIGVRDELSLENLKRWNGTESVERAVVSGDDAILPIIRARDGGDQSDQSQLQHDEQSTDAPVINVHLSIENYVTTHPVKLLKTFESVVSSLRDIAGSDPIFNLLVAYRDSRISERSIVDQLQSSPALGECPVNVVSCIDEVAQGFPNIGRAQLTVCCSYHVALTSLLLGIPTAFAFSNEYYRHKAEGLKRAFQIPDGLLLNVKHDKPETFRCELERALHDQQYRAQLGARSMQGAANMLLRSISTSTALAKFLTATYVARRDHSYRMTAARLLDTTEQLSDLRLEYGRLLNVANDLSVAARAQARAGQDTVSGYERTIRATRSAVRDKIPANAKVLIVSRGDDEIVQFNGHDGWHFPQTPGGTYAGHHPADSNAAVEHLTKLRDQGAEYIVFPSTAFWWLDYYRGLAQHLDRDHQKIWSDQQCIIYQLSTSRKQERQGRKAAMRSPKPVAATANGSSRLELVDDPIIIYGPPRSGTSYLIHILNRHPDIFITPETRVFVWVHRTLHGETHEFFSVFKHRDRYIEFLKGKYPDLIRDYYRELNEKNARYWGDKNPHYAAADSDGCLQTIVDLYPGARFINIIRDGRGNVASLIQKGWADFDRAHRTWLGHVDTGCAFGRRLSSKQYFELRYEDLIQDDTAMAHRLFDFLEIDIHPHVVTFCDNQQKKRSPINWPERDLSGDLTKSDWDTVLTPEQQLRSLDLLGDHLIAFEYETAASLERIRSGVLESTSSSLARSVSSAVRGALHGRVNGRGDDSELR